MRSRSGSASAEKCTIRKSLGGPGISGLKSSIESFKRAQSFRQNYEKNVARAATDRLHGAGRLAKI
jgi:hypothetical protein